MGPRGEAPGNPATRAPTNPAPSATATPLDPEQRARFHLVRAWESSPLTQANFCVLMRVTPAELEAAIEQVRRDRPRPDKPR
jgi:hypothetical protein